MTYLTWRISVDVFSVYRAAEETVRHKIPVEACIEAFISRDILEPLDWNQKIGPVSKCVITTDILSGCLCSFFVFHSSI